MCVYVLHTLQGALKVRQLTSPERPSQTQVASLSVVQELQRTDYGTRVAWQQHVQDAHWNITDPNLHALSDLQQFLSTSSAKEARLAI